MLQILQAIANLFYLPVDLSCCCCGVFVGLAIPFLAMLLSAGNAAAGDERRELLEIMTVKHQLKPELAAKILEDSLNKWAQLRAKTRPLLWSLGREWPEYVKTFKGEFLAYYGRGLPEQEPLPPSPEESEPDLQLDSPDDSMPPS